MSVRALRVVPRFVLENAQRFDRNQVAFYAEQAVAQWLGFRLQLMGVGIVTVVVFLAALEHRYGSVNSGLVGLSISYALSVTGLLQGCWMKERGKCGAQSSFQMSSRSMLTLFIFFFFFLFFLLLFFLLLVVVVAAAAAAWQRSGDSLHGD